MINHTIDNNPVPFVSVIIPCYNCKEGIKDTLYSLTKQDYPANKWEVIVIDNNSTDSTVKAAKVFQKDFRFLKILHEKKQSSYAARNKGIRNSQGDILAFIDADMTVRPDWISLGVSELIQYQADYLGCKIEVVAKHQKPNSWELYELCTAFPIRQFMEIEGFACTACLLVKRDVFKKIGSFDDDLISGGDHEFGNRVRDNGLEMKYCDKNIMYHPARSTIRELHKKNVRVFNGIADLKKKYPHRFGKLTIKFIVSGFIPRFHLHLKTEQLSQPEKIKMLLIKNYLHYCTALIYLKRFFKRK